MNSLPLSTLIVLGYLTRQAEVFPARAGMNSRADRPRYRMHRKGKLKLYKVEGSTMVKTAELEALIEAGAM